MDRSGERSAIGSGQSNDTNLHYNTPAVQVGNQIRDGAEFVLLVRGKQSEPFQLWSSNDQTATPDFIKQAMRQLDIVPATT